MLVDPELLSPVKGDRRFFWVEFWHTGGLDPVKQSEIIGEGINWFCATSDVAKCVDKAPSAEFVGREANVPDNSERSNTGDSAWFGVLMTIAEGSAVSVSPGTENVRFSVDVTKTELRSLPGVSRISYSSFFSSSEDNSLLASHSLLWATSGLP